MIDFEVVDIPELSSQDRWPGKWGPIYKALAGLPPGKSIRVARNTFKGQPPNARLRPPGDVKLRYITRPEGIYIWLEAKSESDKEAGEGNIPGMAIHPKGWRIQA